MKLLKYFLLTTFVLTACHTPTNPSNNYSSTSEKFIADLYKNNLKDVHSMLEDSSNLQSIKNNLKILNYFLHKNGLPIAEDYKIDTGLMETTILIPVFRGRDTTAGFIIDRIDLKLIFYHTTISDHVGRYIMDIHQLSNQR